MTRITAKLRDTVRWTSQAGGFSKTKTGVVVLVVPPNIRPSDADVSGAGNLCPKSAMKSMARNHESYIVSVDGEYYWPRVSALTVVTSLLIDNVLDDACETTRSEG